jgi:hypothetical protein
MKAQVAVRQRAVDEEERRRREDYARVRASFQLEGMALTPEEERDLEPYFRGEMTLDELTRRALARFRPTNDDGAGDR